MIYREYNFPMDRIDALKAIADQARHGELAFPTSVDATLKLQRALLDPDCHLEAAAKLVQAEPVLAARTVAIANSAAYNHSGHDVTNVNAAVQRVGFRTLGALASSVIVRQLAGELTDPQLRAKADQLWQHSAHVAALAQVLARRVSRVDSDTALFAGIVHEVGGFYLLSRADEFPGLLDEDPENWAELCEDVVSREVLRKLAVPEPVAEAIVELRGAWLGMPPETLRDTLLLANQYSPVASPLGTPPPPPPEHAESALDFVLDEDTLRDIQREAAETFISMDGPPLA